MAKGTRSFTKICSPTNNCSVQKAFLSYLKTNNLNYKTLLNKNTNFNDFAKRYVGNSKPPIDKILPKTPNNSIPKAPNIPQQTVMPNIPKKPSTPSVSKPTPKSIYSALQNDHNKTLKSLEIAKSHQEFAEQKAPVPNNNFQKINTFVPSKNNDSKDKVSSTQNSTNTTLKNNAGHSFQTTINQYTKAEDLTEQDVINEAKKRLLVKPDDGKTSSFIKLEDGTVEKIGVCKNFIKTSPLGQAYHKKQLNKSSTTHSFDNKSEKDDYDFFIATPPSVSQDCIIETGLNKHLLIVKKKDTEEYFAIGYLTSKKGALFLSDTQFKAFQQNDLQTTKQQNYVRLDNAVKIRPEDLKKASGGEQYFNVNVSKDSFNILKVLWDELKRMPYIDYNKNGISKEVLLEMIKDHDIISAKDNKHPLTAEQIKLIEKEKTKVKAEKEAKLKELSSHVENY